ncbi:L-gulonolactone oxidase-like, partial [Melospiza melodia melodia]|uniref:L-gulonolactone oxidase-like n=1 Tax=Melospiza melodia melodia TaxID=1914991 RepID=UPI002FD4F72B
LGGQSGLSFQNWAGTFGCRPERFFRPRHLGDIRQILELARQQGKRVKVVGGGHSPSDIACTDGFMIHMGHLSRVLKVDREKLQVKVQAGILLSQLNLQLDKHGLALQNLGAVSEVTAAGVIGTGTHNTGIQHGILATQVVALTLLLASGELLECSESLNPDVFGAARLHLGALGIVLDVTFQCVPRFRLRQLAFPSTLTQVLDELDEHLSNSRYFRFLWFPHTENVQPPRSSSSWFWDYAVGFHLLQLLLWISSFFPSLVVWINRAFFRLLFSSRQESVGRSHQILNYECRFRQHVQDWAVPIGRTRAALLELRAALAADPGLGAHFPVEIRFCRRDRIPLSPCFRRDSCYINVVMYRPYGRAVSHGRYWELYEGIMRRHGGRPHWAK